MEPNISFISFSLRLRQFCRFQFLVSYFHARVQLLHKLLQFNHSTILSLNYWLFCWINKTWNKTVLLSPNEAKRDTKCHSGYELYPAGNNGGKICRSTLYRSGYSELAWTDKRHGFVQYKGCWTKVNYPITQGARFSRNRVWYYVLNYITVSS